MKKEKGIDDIFKHGLQNPPNEAEFAEHDWDALENMLDKKLTGGKVYWMPYVSAAAAMLLIAFGWWMFKPAGTTVQNGQQVVKNQPKVKAPVADTTRPQPEIAVAPSNQIAKDDEVKNANKEESTHSEKINAEKAFVNNSYNTKRSKIPAPNGTKQIVDRNLSVDTARPMIAAAAWINENRETNTREEISSSHVITASDFEAHQEVKKLAQNVNVRPLAPSKIDSKKTSSFAFRPQFALTVLASPELNGISSLKSASKGTNVGMLFTVSYKKFSLTTGAAYTVKPYTLPYSQYPSSYSYKTTPETVTADCRMLDIPINIGYQLLNKSGNKFTLGTGLSSYIMTHETYTYDYAASAKKIYGPSFYAVENRGKYPFSIMNVQATYERQINSKIGISLQPYYKIPLSAIGYSQVRVQTFGVAVGLNWNINQLTKPK